MREVHLINLTEMDNIMMTSFLIKFKYLLKGWEDVMKIENNKCEKC